MAKGIGRIHVITKLDEHVEIGFNEIVVLDEVPIQSAAGRRRYYLATFNSAFAYQPAGERLGCSQRLHQKRARVTETV